MHNSGQHTGQPFKPPRPEKDMLLMMRMIMMMICHYLFYCLVYSRDPHSDIIYAQSLSLCKAPSG